MTIPRSLIEADVTLPEYRVEWRALPGSWTPINDDDVIEVSGVVENAFRDRGVAFGAFSTASAEVRLTRGAMTFDWRNAQIRVWYGFGGSAKVIGFAGVVSRASWRGHEVTLECRGYDALISRTAAYSPLLARRPASTRTSAVSVEDPDDPNWQGGLVNFIFWRAGGRPLEQQNAYPNAAFYYTCDVSPISVEYAWVAGEDAWGELDRLAKATGCTIAQRRDGVMTCRSVLRFGEGGSPGFTFSEAWRGPLEATAECEESVTAVRCAYTRRAAFPGDVAYEEKERRVIAPGETLTATITPDAPVAAWDMTPQFNAVFFDGQPASASVALSNASAGRVTVTFHNPHSAPIIISDLRLRARRLLPVAKGVVRVGGGDVEREVGEDVLIQSEMHARRLATLALDVYQHPRIVYTLPQCGYDPAREVGELIAISDAEWGLSNLLCRITAIRHERTGALMTIEATPIGGLPAESALFIVGQSYSAGDVRMLGY